MVIDLPSQDLTDEGLDGDSGGFGFAFNVVRVEMALEDFAVKAGGLGLGPREEFCLERESRRFRSGCGADSSS